VLDEQADSHESAAAEADANFALMSLEYQRLLERLEAIFKLPRPE
jgi:recombination associated protein RdgC